MVLRPAESRYTTEGEADFDGFRTWYGVVGNLASSRHPQGKAPLVVAHGGAGSTHDSLLPISALARHDRPVVFYDQIGNGRSTHLPDRGAEFWTVELFVREMANLVEHLGIAERHHVLGHSWGGFLAQEYGITQPPGLRSLVLSNTGASYPTFIAALQRLKAELPAEVQVILERHEQAGTTDSQEYIDACGVFAARHFCRLARPWPDELVSALAAPTADPHVQRVTMGSILDVTGSHRDLETTDRLRYIQVPTLVISGAHDQATPELQDALVSRLPQSEQVLLGRSSHLPMWEEPQSYLGAVASFLDRHD